MNIFFLNRVYFFLNLFDLRNSIKNLSFLVFAVAALAINLDFAYSYRPSTVISHDEAMALDGLKKVAKRDDYVFSWWDYGYAIRYFADVETLGDLVQYNKTDLLKFRNFGKKSLSELDDLLESLNLSFGTDITKYKLDKE